MRQWGGIRQGEKLGPLANVKAVEDWTHPQSPEPYAAE